MGPESPQEQYNAPRSKGATASVEAMRDPGFHIGKIDTDTLNTMDGFGLSIKNGKENGEGIVTLNADKKFHTTLITDNGEPKKGYESINIDKGTKRLSSFVMGGKGHGSALVITSENYDGSTDKIIFTKEPSPDSLMKDKTIPENKEFLTASSIDAQLTNGTIKPKDLVNNSFIQKSIIREWNNISDASVLKVKEYTIRLAKEAYPNDTLARLSPQDISIINRLPVLKMGLPLQGKDGIVFDDNNPGFTVVSKKDPSKELLRLTIDK